MSESPAVPNHLTGSRRLSLTMLTVRDRADGFTGLPPGTAKPLKFLAAFQEAEPYLGLPAHAFKLVSWLVKQTMPCDWEQGSRPIAWPSARREGEFLALSPARVKVLNRALFDGRGGRNACPVRCPGSRRCRRRRQILMTAPNVCPEPQKFAGRPAG